MLTESSSPAAGEADWACTGPAQHLFAGGPVHRPTRTELLDAAFVRHTT